jgi:hypothetical protein
MTSVLPRGIAAAVFGDHEPADAVGAEVVGDHVALPVVGQMPAADDLQAAVLGAAGVEAGDDPLRAGGGDEDRAGEDVVDPFAVGAVGGERLPPAVEVMPPGFTKAAQKTSSSIVSGRNRQMPPPLSRFTP